MKWISVKDKLPPEHEEILIYDKGVFMVYFYKINGVNKWNDKHLWGTYTPTHWMPLPDKP